MDRCRFHLSCRALAIVLGLTFVSPVVSQTNTPFSEGTRVTVTTEAGIVEGTLQKSADPKWIRLKEHESASSTAITADALIVRSLTEATNRTSSDLRIGIAPEVHTRKERRSQPSDLATRKRSSAPLIGYVLLEAEFPASGQGEAEHRSRIDRLDLLSSQVLEKVKPDLDLTSEADAKEVLGIIDTVLAENDYQIWIPSECLWDALARSKDQEGIPYSTAMRRRADRDGSAYTAQYVFDCDTGSLIYLHILQQLNAPVCLVETKRHNFVRWRFDNASYLNWDANAGAAFDDDEYRAGGVGLSSGFSREEEELEGYLKDMSRDDVVAYHLRLVAQKYRDRDAFEDAIDTYKKCIQLAPEKPVPHNNLAWMIAVEPALQEPDLLDLALAEAKETVHLRPRDGNFIDTLAAVYAARRDFARALEWERSEYGNKDPNRIAAYEDGTKTPAELGWE